MMTQTFESRWFTLSLQVGLWLLLGLIVLRWRGAIPAWNDAPAENPMATSALPTSALNNLFASESWAFSGSAAGSLSPFATRHFIPTVASVAPPTTRKIELVYQGYSRAAAKPESVFLQTDNKMAVLPLGSRIAPELFLATVNARECTLTNNAAQTHRLKLNTKTVLEVSVK